ncbi:hypothetical protein AYI69_g9025 [Smittium culicis]|uniref:Uncharacterized protein n=1 Tax=Smittium culicis TaxID=133412 RepID=A0A1R1XFI0_9FUNG|nr:hypothetical protein AYI69_g9025 [Smittium culicis]
MTSETSKKPQAAAEVPLEKSESSHDRITRKFENEGTLNGTTLIANSGVLSDDIFSHAFRPSNNFSTLTTDYQGILR